MKIDCAKKTNGKIRLLFGLSIVIILFSFMSYYIYIREPIGDDVLGVFSKSYTYYLDDCTFELGDRVKSISQIVELVVYLYRNWSGRVPGYFVCGFIAMTPRIIQALFISAVYIAVVILALRIVYKSTNEILLHPVSILLLYGVLFWYKYAVAYTYMRTMTSLYLFSLLCGLLYINLYNSRDIKRDNKLCYFLFQLFGLIVGSCHEVYSAFVISIIGIEWLIEIYQKKTKIKAIFDHVGLVIGYLIGFFAPGNFSRIQETHDKVIDPFSKRYSNSIFSHKSILIGNRVAKAIFILLILFIIISIIYLAIKRRGKLNLVPLFYSILPYISTCVLSVLIWSIMNHVAIYGLDAFIVFSYIIIFQAINYFRPSLYDNNGNFSLLLSIVILFLFTIFNYQEIKVVDSISNARRRNIEESINKGEEYALLQRYPDNLSADRYFLDYLNGQEHYSTDYYEKYYGVKMIIQ